MLDRLQKSTGLEGFGSTIRSRYLATHPTHACSEHFRRFASGRIARSELCVLRIVAFAPSPERAKRAPWRRPC